MQGIFKFCAGAALVVLTATAAVAQERDLTPQEARGLAQSLMESGQVADAAVLADALLQRNPRDVTALVVRGEAALVAGDFAGAVGFATRAYNATEDGRSKFIAARLAAQAHAEQRQDTRAQLWLRRARQFAPNDAASAGVARDFQFLRDRNPFAVSLRFGVTPSSNINNGSANETLSLFGLPFEFTLDREGQPLAGLEISGGTTLSYRLREDRMSETTLTFDVQARTYKIAPSDRDELVAERDDDIARCAERIDPDACVASVGPVADGSDFSDATAKLGLVHRQIFAEGMRPTVFRYSVARSYYGGDPFSKFADASVTQSWDISPTDRVELSVSGQNRRSLDGDDPVISYGADASWLHIFGNGDLMRLSVGKRESDSFDVDDDFSSLSLGASYDFAESWNGVRFGVAVDLEERNFAATSYQPGARKDESVTGRVSMQFTDVEYYGFQPVLNLEATRKSSNVDLFDREYVSLGFDLRSSF